LGALFVAPVLVVVSIPALRRQAEREGDPRLFAFLAWALILKLAASLARHFVAFTVYAGVADAAGYHADGIRLSERFWSGNFATGLESLSGTDFIRFLTGLLYSVIGSSQLAGFLVYSWLGFWGLFCFYRAYTIAVPGGRRMSYRWLIFFLPSLLYWPSSIGKEAWMMFAIGVTALGAAYLIAHRLRRGLLWFALGIWGTALVRPHVAAMLGVALVVALLVRRPRPELRQLAPIAKALPILAVAVAGALLIVRTDRFLKSSLDVSVSTGVSSVLQEVENRTGKGTSSFAPSVLESPLRAPVAAVTVVYRPLLFEAHNAQALIAAVEGTYLLVLSVIRFRWILAALGSMRRQPYVAFALAYCAVFVLGFSAVANFGLLARERVQLLPFFLIFLTVPPREDARALGDS
jgi:hypothetical protein